MGIIIDCRSCRQAGHAKCQCVNDGMLKEGQTMHVSMFMSDSGKAIDPQAAYEQRISEAWRNPQPAPVNETASENARLLREKRAEVERVYGGTS